MNKKISISLLCLLIAGFVFTEACKKKDIGYNPTPLTFVTPTGWPAPVYDFTANPLTQEGFELGKKLFFDKTLSIDNTVSCGTCHDPGAGFSHTDHGPAHGVNGLLTTRNPPGLYNLAWKKELMWDGSISHLDLQPEFPLTAPNEMGETLSNVLKKIAANENYRSLFKKAYGDETVSKERMFKALSQFMLLIVSNNSKYDRVKRGEASFNLAEGLGYDIFKTKCASCHVEPFFTDYSYRNNGMPLAPFYNDFGRMLVTKNRLDSLKFQVPSLRNVGFSYPYGHDGRFATLQNVFNHYKDNVVNAPETDPLVRSKIPLSNFEIGQLQAFLFTLNDTLLTKDHRFLNH